MAGGVQKLVVGQEATSLRDESGRLEILLRFLNGDLLLAPELHIVADTPLFEGGLVNSLQLLQLLGFLEEITGKRIPDDLVVLDRFATARRIAENFLRP